jgi:asparagine synthase (glutamine-hydrolysing)
MCGIVGMISDKNTALIKEMMDTVAHRGPDDSGSFVFENLALGFRRLSIQDISANGHQPMISADGRYCIVFNGEIYNHWEIRKTISHKYSFKSTSDTETILYGFAEYGTDLFKMLNGIFALAIFDKQKRQLIICRDQFGVKPLYYYQKENTILFGSEIKSFLPIPGWDKSIDYSALVNYLHFLWSPGEQTPFQYVNKMPSGHFAILDIDKPVKIKPQQYYEIPFTGSYRNLSEQEWIQQLDEMLSKAVEKQLLSDVPVGYFLSGGLDSSIIVAKARQLSGKKLNCYTIAADSKSLRNEGFSDDLHYARKVAKHLDVHLEIVETNVDIVNDFDKMVWHLDEPQADAAPLNVMNICRRARQKGDIVLLGGTAGDDLFSGYRRHQALHYEKYFKMMPSVMRQGIQAVANNLHNSNPTSRRIKKFSRNLHKPLLDRMAGYFEWLPLQTNMSLFSTAIQQQIGGYDPAQILIEALNNIPDEKSATNQFLYWEMKFFLADHNLNYTDKLSMAEGIEVRVPFLDLELVKLSTTMPPHLKLNGKTTKYLLRKVAEKYLPEDIIHRPKSGFGAPIRNWITNDMQEMIQDYLSPKNIQDRGIFNAQNIQKLILENKNGNIDASYSIWSLLAIESWMRQFVD